ncbi:hypothetical protein GUITHDRAFT_116287 [Guillardia theta CCMP2712]|uniref:Uncharacterized protein n=1 Tax=Guillardia theta (strain CCMP2712) TaxID=905079 RepID=L1IMI5_GUITC|nr:hypothetical protein GUITHDRAFT_116287 [Guillardia theta CCMP2712]EKX37476.1 hypothetical protein GUITHDRAFT_116287 [Guillardia theta CCMP2712]|eukprot:XP_005824456.1 hypothetical protein GUITHDRAFT_116287 [Guillardia theta CCMP2712]
MSAVASKPSAQDPSSELPGATAPCVRNRVLERVVHPSPRGEDLRIADKYFFQELSKSAGNEAGMRWLHERVVKSDPYAGVSNGCSSTALSDYETSEEDEEDEDEGEGGNLMDFAFVEKYRNSQSQHLEPTCVYALLNEGYESMMNRLWSWLVVMFAFLGWFQPRGEEVKLEESAPVEEISEVVAEEASKDKEETKSQQSEEDGINRSSSTEGESSSLPRPRPRKSSSLGRMLRTVDKEKKGLIYTDAAHLLWD